jgi:hypothetical protein
MLKHTSRNFFLKRYKFVTTNKEVYEGFIATQEYDPKVWLWSKFCAGFKTDMELARLDTTLGLAILYDTNDKALIEYYSSLVYWFVNFIFNFYPRIYFERILFCQLCCLLDIISCLSDKWYDFKIVRPKIKYLCFKLLQHDLLLKTRQNSNCIFKNSKKYWNWSKFYIPWREKYCTQIDCEWLYVIEEKLMNEFGPLLLIPILKLQSPEQ